jgi:hypothetical protein
MMYPIPYPSGTTGPNPKSLRLGFPQLLVLKTVWFRVCHPPSLKRPGVYDEEQAKQEI